MSATGESTEKLMADLRVIVRDAEDVLRATAGDMSEKAKETRARLSASLESAKAACYRLEEKAMDGARVADGVIREHPYQTIGIAFGVGVLIGVLVGRR